jgi:hypothetical protein
MIDSLRELGGPQTLIQTPLGILDTQKRVLYPCNHRLRNPATLLWGSRGEMAAQPPETVTEYLGASTNTTRSIC